MAIKHLTNIDFSRNQALNMLLQILASDPSSPAATEGQIWYRSDDDTIRFQTANASRKLAELVASGAVAVTYGTNGTVTVGVSKAAVDALNIDAATLGGLSSSAFAAASHTHAISDVTNLQTALDGKLATTLKGANNGLAELDSGGKVPTTQLPDAVFGGLSYQGTWNADTNSPTLNNAGATGNAGKFYKVATAGTTNLSGITDWGIGDWVISDGVDWQKIDNSEIISSVNGKTGAVVIGIADIANLQTSLDAKQATITGAATTITSDNLTASRALASDTNGKVAVSSVTDTELGYLSGVTSAIQTQINARTRIFTQSMGSAAVGPLTVTHNLNTQNVQVQVWDITSTPIQVFTEITVTDANNVQIAYNGSHKLRVVVIA
jgi:hypothetical protein